MLEFITRKSFEKGVFKNYKKKCELLHITPTSKSDFFALLKTLRNCLEYLKKEKNQPAPYAAADIDGTFDMYAELTKNDNFVVNIWTKDQTQILLNGDKI